MHGEFIIVYIYSLSHQPVYDKSNNRGKYFLACILSFTKCCVRSDCSFYEFCIRQMCIHTHLHTALSFSEIFGCHPDAIAIPYDDDGNERRQTNTTPLKWTLSEMTMVDMEY